MKVFRVDRRRQIQNGSRLNPKAKKIRKSPRKVPRTHEMTKKRRQVSFISQLREFFCPYHNWHYITILCVLYYHIPTQTLMWHPVVWASCEYNIGRKTQLSLRFPCVRRRVFFISAQAPQAMFSSSEKRVVTGMHDSVRDSFVVMFWRLYSFALVSISLRDFPLLKDIIEGSLNISFNKGWF